jgi:heat-inducible transcriptional repressor
MADQPFLPISELNERSRAIFREIVETYLETGEPVGSRTLSRAGPVSLSPASIRNVMADLEAMGLLYAPHTSAGRLPTERGLRLFVDGLLELGDLTSEERASIEAQISGSARSMEEVLTEATALLSGLSRCAGVVVAPKTDVPLKHIEFLSIGPGRVLVIIVGEDGQVENRVIDAPAGVTPSQLAEASNYLSARLAGRTIDEAREVIRRDMADQRAELDRLTQSIVEAGLATWSGSGQDDAPAALIVRGQSRLLEDLEAQEDLERIRRLFDDLENKKDLMRLLDLAKSGEGVRIFIGSENKLFSLSGSSVIVAPYRDARQKIVGIIGVIGPTRVNYARVIPMVDYTAKVVGRLLT